MGTFISDTLFEVCLQIVSEQQLILITKKKPTFCLLPIVTGLIFGGIIGGQYGAFICGSIGLIVGTIYVTHPRFYNKESLYIYMKNKIKPDEKKMLAERVQQNLESGLNGDISVILPIIKVSLSENQKSIIIRSIQCHMNNKRNVVQIIAKPSYLLV